MTSEFLTPVFVLGIIFGTVLGIVYLSIRSKERKMLVERGLDARIFETKTRVPSSLKWGLLMVGLGVGIIIGRILAEYTVMSEESAFFSMIFLCGGISLLIYHFMAYRWEKNRNGNNPPQA
jgi:hypothetical protein